MLEVLFDVAKLESELHDLEHQTTQSNFWQDSSYSSKILKQINLLKAKTEGYKKRLQDYEYIQELTEIVNEELNSLGIKLDNIDLKLSNFSLI